MIYSIRDGGGGGKRALGPFLLLLVVEMPAAARSFPFARFEKSAHDSFPLFLILMPRATDWETAFRDTRILREGGREFGENVKPSLFRQ